MREEEEQERHETRERTTGTRYPQQNGNKGIARLRFAPPPIVHPELATAQLGLTPEEAKEIHKECMRAQEEIQREIGRKTESDANKRPSRMCTTSTTHQTSTTHTMRQTMTCTLHHQSPTSSPTTRPPAWSSKMAQSSHSSMTMMPWDLQKWTGQQRWRRRVDSQKRVCTYPLTTTQDPLLHPGTQPTPLHRNIRAPGPTTHLPTPGTTPHAPTTCLDAPGSTPTRVPHPHDALLLKTERVM